MTRRRVTTASRHNSDQDVKGVGKIIERNWSGLMTDAILAGVPGTKQERTNEGGIGIGRGMRTGTGMAYNL